MSREVTDPQRLSEQLEQRQLQEPEIELVERGGETTLYIDRGQAMQGWEKDLMDESADILCQYGSQFLEVGLGLGLSALRIATHPNTRRHTVIEKYRKVIDLFVERQASLPSTLEIVHADFFDYVHELQPESLDGIFFDPYLPKEMRTDESLWAEVTPLMFRALRLGGALVPYFSTRPALLWQFYPYCNRIVVERRRFRAYDTTDYTYGTEGDAFIQCFVKTA